jgi:hypothetical protein
MHPTAVSRKRMTNNPIRQKPEVDQPERQIRSAKSMETSPVNRIAEEKKMKTRPPLPARRDGNRAGVGDEAAAIVQYGKWV